MADLLAQIRGCTACAAALPHPPRPLLQAGAGARLLIVSQAPGSRGQATGIPFGDASGARLREWLVIDEAVFYDPARVALIPMGFCYPGKGASGDLPPRRECADLWHGRLRAALQPRLTLLVGAHAQRAWLPREAFAGMAEAVARPEAMPVGTMAMPHPSWRSTGWMARNPWFARDILPELRARVARALT